MFERPTLWQHLTNAEKEERERVQVERFLRDYCQATGEDLATEYRRGGDPPDFVLVGPTTQRLGLECTQLVYSDRILAWDASERLRSSLLSVDRNRFRHLRGSIVYMTIDSEDGLPPPGRQGTREVAAALQRFHPAANDFSDLPATLEGTNIAQSFGRYSLTAAQPPDLVPTGFVRLMGFDLALAIQSDVLGSEAWERLIDRVREKDRAGSDAVLVSCGAPVVKGLSFPSDDLAAEAIALAATEESLPPTLHIEMVYLHTWDSERVVKLKPGVVGAELLAPI